MRNLRDFKLMNILQKFAEHPIITDDYARKWWFFAPIWPTGLLGDIVRRPIRTHYVKVSVTNTIEVPGLGVFVSSDIPDNGAANANR